MKVFISAVILFAAVLADASEQNIRRKMVRALEDQVKHERSFKTFAEQTLDGAQGGYMSTCKTATEKKMAAKCSAGEDAAREEIEWATIVEEQLATDFDALVEALAECKVALDFQYEKWGCNPPENSDELNRMVVELDYTKRHCAQLKGVPTGTKPLLGGNDNAATELMTCTGECDRDSQCAAGLECFQRSDGEGIPGCQGTNPNDAGTQDWDYCYDPTRSVGDTIEILEGPKTVVSVALSGTDNNNAKNLRACTGECDNDDQCAAGLKCFQRSKGEAIPGCHGTNSNDPGTQNWDYCYDPTITSYGNLWVGFDDSKDSVALADLFKQIESRGPATTELENRAEELIADSKNCWNKIKKKCDFGEHVFGGLVSSLKNAVAAIGVAIMAIINAIGCTVLEVGLAILGAVIDAALLSTGATAGFASLPWYVPMCLDIGAGSAKTMKKKKAEMVEQFDTPNRTAAIEAFDKAEKAAMKDGIGSKMDAASGVMEGHGAALFINGVVSHCISDSTLGFTHQGDQYGVGCDPDALLQTNSTSAMKLRRHLQGDKNSVTLSVQDGLQFLYTFIMTILASTDLVSEKEKGLADTIFWILMRLWEGMCGQFGTAVMNIVRELAVCNLCTICPPSACTVKVFAFTDECKDAQLYSTKDEMAHENENMYNYAMLGDFEATSVTPMDITNDGSQDCDSWCRENHFPGGASGAVYTTTLDPSTDQAVMLAMFADGPLHLKTVEVAATADAPAHQDVSSACCPAGNIYGKDSDCRTCECKGPKEIKLSTYADDNDAEDLQACKGECDDDDQCASGLKCFQRTYGGKIPGCYGPGGDFGTLGKWDYCYAPYPTSATLGGDNDNDATNLPACRGECDGDWQCAPGLRCFQRLGKESIPGCSGSGTSGLDYCYDPLIPGRLQGKNLNSIPEHGFMACTNECDKDSDCGHGLFCFQRDNYDDIPGCYGDAKKDWDYCVLEIYRQ